MIHCVNNHYGGPARSCIRRKFANEQSNLLYESFGSFALYRKRMTPGQSVGKLLKSGTSVPANYRAPCRARSKAEFVAKIGVVVEEADETMFWLELLNDTRIIAQTKLNNLLKEANELLSILPLPRKPLRGVRAK